MANGKPANQQRDDDKPDQSQPSFDAVQDDAVDMDARHDGGRHNMDMMGRRPPSLLGDGECCHCYFYVIFYWWNKRAIVLTWSAYCKSGTVS